MSQRTPLVHPFTFLLTGWIDTSVAYVNNKAPASRNSLRVLYWLAISLDAKGQKKLQKEIIKMEDLLDRKKQVRIETYRELYKVVMRELHEEGYFIAAKSRPPTRAKTMHDLEMVIAKETRGK
jgi:hypothetical protein